MPYSASQKAVDRKACLAGKTQSIRFAHGAGSGPVLVKRRNAASDHFLARPKEATQRPQSGVAALAKDAAIRCAPRLVLVPLGRSEQGIITLKGYL